MLIKINKKYDDIISKCLLAILILWPLFFITRGIDFMDSGFYLSQYRYYFGNNINTAAATELSNFFGAILYKLLPEAKFISFRILDWIASSIGWFFAYKTSSKSLPKTWSALAVLVGSFYIRRYPMMLSYNSFSFMFISIAMYYLQVGIIEKNNKSIITSGALIGFNVFFRLPNALQCLYVFIPLLSLLSLSNAERKAQIKYVFNQCIYFTIAGFVGLFAGLAICVISKGFAGTVHSIAFTISLLGEGNHATSSVFERMDKEFTIFKTYIHNLARYPYYILAVGVFSGLVRYFIKNKIIVYSTIAAALVAMAKICSITIDNLSYLNNITVFVPYFLTLIFSVISLAFIYKNRNAFITTLMFLLLMLISPIGTDNGIMHSCLFMYIVISNLLVSLNGFTIKNEMIKQIAKSTITVFSAIVLITFGVAGTKNILLSVSYNDGPIFKQNCSVDIPDLKGMKTINTRAEAIQSVYNELHSATEYQDRELLMFGNFSLVYAVTDYKPFGREVWVNLEHIDKDKIFEELDSVSNKPIILFENIDKTDYLFSREYMEKVDKKSTEYGYTKIEKEYYTIYYPTI